MRRAPSILFAAIDALSALNDDPCAAPDHRAVFSSPESTFLAYWRSHYTVSLETVGRDGDVIMLSKCSQYLHLGYFVRLRLPASGYEYFLSLLLAGVTNAYTPAVQFCATTTCVAVLWKLQASRCRLMGWQVMASLSIGVWSPDGAVTKARRWRELRAKDSLLG